MLPPLFNLNPSTYMRYNKNTFDSTCNFKADEYAGEKMFNFQNRLI